MPQFEPKFCWTIGTIGSVKYIMPLSHFVSLQVLPASFCEYFSLLSCSGLSFMSDDSVMLKTNSLTSILIYLLSI